MIYAQGLEDRKLYDVLRLELVPRNAARGGAGTRTMLPLCVPMICSHFRSARRARKHRAHNIEDIVADHFVSGDEEGACRIAVPVDGSEVLREPSVLQPRLLVIFVIVVAVVVIVVLRLRFSLLFNIVVSIDLPFLIPTIPASFCTIWLVHCAYAIARRCLIASRWGLSFRLIVCSYVSESERGACHVDGRGASGFMACAGLKREGSESPSSC